MAVDEAILGEVLNGNSPPTLRFYAWEPFCLSLGYAQLSDDVDMDRLTQHGWQLVRRRTGGRAILHGDELTYSVILPPNHPLATGTIVDSYRRLSQALLQGLQLLAVLSHAQPKQDKQPNTNQAPVCFEVPSDYEITAEGRKLVGSAQMRRRGAVLQHGSLPLYGDITRICDVLRYPSEHERTDAKAQVRSRATTLALVSGDSHLGWDAVANAIQKGFEDVHGIDFTVGTLTPRELEQAVELERDVYTNLNWVLNKRIMA